ncbi:histidine triad nucleotide-binding protein [Aeromicrobium halocynthiae]|uniref:Histidine triad nucleotide-binding protein n=1 Tax=Aeromicrobium halocynthiae TaxID=560557 RepID=A0ABN2VYB8_9ACTN
MSDCLFCKILDGEVPSDEVASNDHAYAFRDVSPQAPTHVLVIPRRHEPDVGSLVEADPDAAVAVLGLAKQVADEVGGSYRLVFNTGADAHQSVFHCHAHVLAGRSLGWPPG